MNAFINEFLDVLNIDIYKAKEIFLDPIFLVMTIVSIIIILIGFMKINKKASKSQIAAFIPFWREWIWFKLADRNPFELVFIIVYGIVLVFAEYLKDYGISSFLSIFELVYIVIIIYIYISLISRIGENFGKSVFYRVFMLLLPTVFFPVIGYSN
ncbi:MAG TPA: hypothetical protein PKY25_01820, partial [Bacilli bacterium]|nr:hypothetical protein [Bacilli bacterium]